MNVEKFIDILNADYFTGVPDSQLKALCDFLMDKYGIDRAHHIIAANEGNCVGIAAGYHLATGKVPVVYLQNSGLGNIINPVASLLNEKVYGIPVIFVIGWRGEPGVPDEPQHIFQGEITLKLLEDIGIDYFVLNKDNTDEEAREAMDGFKEQLENGKSVAFVVRKGALSSDKKPEYKNEYEMTREGVLEKILEVTGDDPIVCTTGKASRELFELREKRGQGHEHDFLTVGSMGHASSIALGIALSKPKRRIWCIDGDGAALMHMGAIAVIGATAPDNLVHIVINNEAHESVGGQPTVGARVDFRKIALGCEYDEMVSAGDYESLENVLTELNDKKGLIFLEVKSAIGSRGDLGRPTTTSVHNKHEFMECLSYKQ